MLSGNSQVGYCYDENNGKENTHTSIFGTILWRYSDNVMCNDCT